MTLSKDSRFKKPQKPEKDRKKEQKALLTRLALSAGTGLVAFAVLLLAAAAVSLTLDIAREQLAWVGIPLAAAAAFLAGDLHVRPLRKQGLLFGLLSGAALYVGVLVLAVIISRATLGVNAVLLLLATLLGGAAGGIFAANRRPSQSRGSAKTRRR